VVDLGGGGVFPSLYAVLAQGVLVDVAPPYGSPPVVVSSTGW